MELQSQTPVQPPLPFELPPKRKRRKHESHRRHGASVEAFEEAKQHCNSTFLYLLNLLKEFDSPVPGENLTAREMLDILKARGIINPDAERNRISPRLSELLDLGCVENVCVLNDEGEAVFFLKRVKNYSAGSVWRITSKGHELLDTLEKLKREVSK